MKLLFTRKYNAEFKKILQKKSTNSRSKFTKEFFNFYESLKLNPEMGKKLEIPIFKPYKLRYIVIQNCYFFYSVDEQKITALIIVPGNRDYIKVLKNILF